MFTIEFFRGGSAEGELGDAALEGRLVLGEEEEVFSAAVGFWSPGDYQLQWRRGVERVVREQLPSCLVTSIGDPSKTSFLSWWTLYPRGDHVKVQNALLFFDQGARPFDTAAIYEQVPVRRTFTSDGDPVSEWDVLLSDFKAFLARNHPGDPTNP